MSTDNLFNEVPRTASLASRVARQIQDVIVTGKIKPGERLPTETSLGEQFGVSRTVIREALRELVAKNLVEVQPGAGTIVREISNNAVTESISLLLSMGRDDLDSAELVEVRRCLELEIARLSALRRTADDLDRLTALVEQMEGALNNAEAFSRYDIAFHSALADATQNRLFAVLLNSIIDIMLQSSQLVSTDPKRRVGAIAFHRAILEQVSAQNPVGAVEAMRDHLATFAEATSHLADKDGQLAE